jgi:ParB family chromosome partitioning protein
VIAPAALAVAPSPAGQAPKSFTGAGIFMSAITGKDEVSKELVDVQRKLDAATSLLGNFEGAEVTRLLDAKLIHPSHWANRNEASFKSADFENLKLEIESAGGNVQAIKVRPRLGTPGEFEIVFGHRRHRACLVLGLPVLAVIEELTDVELFTQMERENRQRADLRPFEQGVMYARALDEGLFPSLRKMSDALGVDAGNASKAMTLARLPAQVLAAFSSPLDLQQAWSTNLSAALQKDPDVVLRRAAFLAKMDPKPTAGHVFKELIGGGVVSNNTPMPELVSIKGEGAKSGKIVFNPKKGTFEISLTGLDASQMKTVEKAIKSLIS